MLASAVRTYRRQEILYHIVLPVADLTLAFDFLLQIVAVVYVETCVVVEVSELDLIDALHEHCIACIICYDRVAPRIVSRSRLIPVVAFVLLLAV